MLVLIELDNDEGAVVLKGPARDALGALLQSAEDIQGVGE